VIQSLQTTITFVVVHRSKNSTIDSPFLIPHSVSLSFHLYAEHFPLYLAVPLSFVTTFSEFSQLHPPLAASAPSLLSAYFPILKFPAATAMLSWPLALLSP